MTKSPHLRRNKGLLWTVVIANECSSSKGNRSSSSSSISRRMEKNEWTNLSPVVFFSFSFARQRSTFSLSLSFAVRLRFQLIVFSPIEEEKENEDEEEKWPTLSVFFLFVRFSKDVNNRTRLLGVIASVQIQRSHAQAASQLVECRIRFGDQPKALSPFRFVVENKSSETRVSKSTKKQQYWLLHKWACPNK